LQRSIYEKSKTTFWNHALAFCHPCTCLRFSLLALLTLIFSIQIIRRILSNSENVPALIPAMGQNVLVNLLTPVLLAIGLFIG